MRTNRARDIHKFFLEDCMINLNTDDGYRGPLVTAAQENGSASCDYDWRPLCSIAVQVERKCKLGLITYFMYIDIQLL